MITTFASASVPVGSQGAAELSAARTVQSRVLSRCLELPVLGGNRVNVLDDPRQVRDAVFSAIDRAVDHVNIDSGLFDLVGHGDELVTRLLSRCEAGVRINLLFEATGFGATGPAQQLERLRRGGAKLCAIPPAPRWRRWWDRAPAEARKLIVIDGRVALVGGLDLRRSGLKSDGLVRIAGPAVAELQWLFIDHWERSAIAPLHPARYFPALAWVGAHRVGIAAATSAAGRSPFLRALTAAVNAAQRRIWLTSVNGLPNPSVQQALVAACQRGVDVRVNWSAGPRTWLHWPVGGQAKALARAGVRMHEAAEGRLHARSSVIDGVWSCVGSGLDGHAPLHGPGMDLIVLDADFGARVEAAFRADIARRIHAARDRRSALRHPLQRAHVKLSRYLELGL